MSEVKAVLIVEYVPTVDTRSKPRGSRPCNAPRSGLRHIDHRAGSKSAQLLPTGSVQRRPQQPPSSGHSSACVLNAQAVCIMSPSITCRTGLNSLQSERNHGTEQIRV